MGRICGNHSIQLWWFNTGGTQMVSWFEYSSSGVLSLSLASGRTNQGRNLYLDTWESITRCVFWLFAITIECSKAIWPRGRHRLQTVRTAVPRYLILNTLGYHFHNGNSGCDGVYSLKFSKYRMVIQWAGRQIIKNLELVLTGLTSTFNG